MLVSIVVDQAVHTVICGLNMLNSREERSYTYVRTLGILTYHSTLKEKSQQNPPLKDGRADRHQPITIKSLRITNRETGTDS